MSDKYKELLDAVHALDPNKEFFTLRSNASGRTTCTYCLLDNTIYGPKHTAECPVTLLRNVLNEAEEKKCSEDQGYKLVYAPHRDELDKAIQIIERHRLSKLNAKAVIDYSGALESAIVDEVLYIKNASDKDVVIPLDKPFIKSPTDNGVVENKYNEVEEARVKSMVHVVDEPEVMITMEAVTQKSYGLAPLKQEGECADPLMFTIDNGA